MHCSSGATAHPMWASISLGFAAVNIGLNFRMLGWTWIAWTACVLCVLVWYSLHISLCSCVFMFLICNAVLPVGIAVMVLSSSIGDNDLSSPRAIGIVIAIELAGLSRVSSGTVDGVPGLELALPALCVWVLTRVLGISVASQRRTLLLSLSLWLWCGRFPLVGFV